MATLTAVANQILIAMPSLVDPHFKQSVVYVCEHHTNGSVGLIINKPMEFPLSFVFDQLRIKSMHEVQKNLPLLFGGPVQPERGFIIHKQAGAWRSSLPLQEGVTVTTSNDIIHALAKGKGPTNVLVTLGFSCWGLDQLEREIMNNCWLVCPYSSELLYEVPFDERWAYAGSLLGVDMNLLSSTVGHA